MKTIQIPMNSNPFTVEINNSVYQYKAGQTMEVPDEVAAAIEDALKLVPKPGRYISRIGSLVDRSITEVTADDWAGVTNVRENAFYGCKNLLRVTIPDSVVDVEYHAFSNCSNLISIVFGDGVTSIAPSFGKCNSLIDITIGKLVKKIIANSFGELTPELNSVTYTFKVTTPPSIWGETYSLHQPKYIKKIIVPKGCAEAYKAATNWAEYAGYIVEDN